MSFFYSTYKYSVGNLDLPSSTYRITDTTFKNILPDIKPSIAPISKYDRLTDNDLVNIYAENRTVFKDIDLESTKTVSLDENLESTKAIVVNQGEEYNSVLKNSILANLDVSSITDNFVNVNFSSITDNSINTRSFTPSILTFQDVFKNQQGLMLDLFGTDEIEAPTVIITNKNNIVSNSTRTDGDDQNNIFKSDSTIEWEIYDGHGGIDTFVTDNSDSYYQITVHSSAYIVLEHFFSDDKSISNEEREALFNIERIEFGNKKLAFDLDGNAGIVAKVYGAVLGKDSILDPELIGSGLDQIDNGLSYENFATIAIKSAGLESSEDIVTTLWTNVVGSEPTPDQAEPYINKLENGEMTVGELGMFAANTELNEDNIALTGLQNSGIEFI